MEEFSTADLDFDNYRASLGILYSSRLILLYSDYLGGRRTVENHLVHMGTSLYRSRHIMTGRYKTWTLDRTMDWTMDWIMDWIMDLIMDSILDLIGQWLVF